MAIIKIEGKSVTVPDEIVGAGKEAIRAALSVDFPGVANSQIEIVKSDKPGAPTVVTVSKVAMSKGLQLRIYGNATGGYHASGDYEANVDPELGACPFRGSQNVTAGNTHSPSYWAECEDCGAHGPHGDAGREGFKRIGTKVKCERLHRTAFSNAVEFWNKRA